MLELTIWIAIRNYTVNIPSYLYKFRKLLYMLFLLLLVVTRTYVIVVSYL